MYLQKFNTMIFIFNITADDDVLMFKNLNIWAIVEQSHRYDVISESGFKTYIWYQSKVGTRDVFRGKHNVEC